jgi:hypothetical protein
MIYRYKKCWVNTKKLKKLVGVDVTVSSEPQSFVEVDCPEANKDDLDEAMAFLGFEYAPE